MPAYRIVGPMKDWPLAQGENVIGSEETADIRLESPRILPRHALLEVRADGVWLLLEEGKAEINGQEAELASKLSRGDVIVVGGVELRLAWTGFEEEHPKVTRRRWWVRLLGWGLAGGVVLFLLALLAMPLFINASLVRELIQRCVERTFKRSAKLEGMEVSVYRGRIRVKKLIVLNKAEFSDVPFISAEDVELRVDVWRLILSLARELSFSLVVKNPVVFVETDEKGAWNVSDIAQRARAALAEVEWPIQAAYDEVEGRIELKEGRLKVARAGEPVEYEFDLTATQEALSRPFTLGVSARSAGGGTAKVELKLEPLESASITPESIKGELAAEFSAFDLAGTGRLSGEARLALQGLDSFGGEFGAKFLGPEGEAGQFRGSFKKEPGKKAAGSVKLRGSWSAGGEDVFEGEMEGALNERAELVLKMRAGEEMTRRIARRIDLGPVEIRGPIETEARVSGPRAECSWELDVKCDRPGVSGKLLGKACLGAGIVPETVSLEKWSSEGGAIELLDASAAARGLGPDEEFSCELRELSFGVDPAAMGIAWRGGRIHVRTEGKGEGGELHLSFAAEERAVPTGLRAKGELKLGEESSARIEFAGWGEGKLEARSSPGKRGLRVRGSFDVGELFRRAGLSRASGKAEIEDLNVESEGPRTNVVWEAHLHSFRLDGGPGVEPLSEERLDAIGNASFEGETITCEKFKISSSTLWCELSGEIASLEKLLGNVSLQLEGDVARLLRAARWAGWLEREVHLEGSVSVALKVDGTKGVLELERAALDCSAGKLVAHGALSGLREGTPGGVLDGKGSLRGEKLAGLLGGRGSGEGKVEFSLRGTEDAVGLDASADLSAVGFALPGIFEKSPGVQARVSMKGMLCPRDAPSLEVKEGEVSLGGLGFSFSAQAGDGSPEVHARAEEMKLPLLASFFPPLAELDPKGELSFALSARPPWDGPHGTVRTDCRFKWPPGGRSSMGLKGEMAVKGRHFSSDELGFDAPGLAGAALCKLEGVLDGRGRVRVKADLACDHLNLRELMEGLRGSSLRTSPLYAEGGLVASKASWGGLSCGRTEGSYSLLGRTLRLESKPSRGLGGTVKGWVRIPLAARAQRSAEAFFERLDLATLWEGVQGRASGRIYWSGEEMPWAEGGASIEAISRGLTLVAKDSRLEKMAEALAIPARLGGIDVTFFVEQGTVILPPTDFAASDGTPLKLSLQVDPGGKLSGTASAGKEEKKELIISGTLSEPEWEER